MLRHYRISLIICLHLYFLFSCVVYLPLDLEKQWGTHIYKNIILYFYSSILMIVYCWRATGESLLTRKRCWELEQPAWTDFSQNSRPYTVLKFSCDSNGHASSPTQCLSFIGHGLHPCNAFSPLVTAYTHAFFYASHITPTNCLFSSCHCWFYLQPDVSVNICQIHHQPRQYMTEISYEVFVCARSNTNNINFQTGLFYF